MATEQSEQNNWNLKSTVFWDITLCSLLKVIRRFGGTSPPSSESKNKSSKKPAWKKVASRETGIWYGDRTEASVHSLHRILNFALFRMADFQATKPRYFYSTGLSLESQTSYSKSKKSCFYETRNLVPPFIWAMHQTREFNQHLHTISIWGYLFSQVVLCQFSGVYIYTYVSQATDNLLSTRCFGSRDRWLAHRIQIL
jgi:hypothetical protein